MTPQNDGHSGDSEAVPSGEIAALRRVVEANLADARAALNLLPERDLLRDYIDNIRFNCEFVLAAHIGSRTEGEAT